MKVLVMCVAVCIAASGMAVETAVAVSPEPTAPSATSIGKVAKTGDTATVSGTAVASAKANDPADKYVKNLTLLTKYPVQEKMVYRKAVNRILKDTRGLDVSPTLLDDTVKQALEGLRLSISQIKDLPNAREALEMMEKSL